MQKILYRLTFAIPLIGFATAAMAGGGGSESGSFEFVVQAVSRIVAKFIDAF